ncbi:amidase family protein, partial [Caulobacter sp. S45]|uniref:amidase family protein n=1 Tax=Caulobacter sp. S45 TaxID=1641861 RepID=UPI0020C67435
MIDPFDYMAMDATALAGAIRDKTVSPVEALDAAIARAEAVNPAINALAHRRYGPARTEAATPAGGPFAGIPWVMKDLGHPMAGVPLTGGSRAFQDVRGTADAELVRRLRAAGLIVFATSTTPEFGLTVTTESSLYGPTRNPWNLERSAGGSSGGAAALVAAGVVPAAHATDGGGS